MAKKKKHNISKRAKGTLPRTNRSKSQKRRISWEVILAIVSLGISLTSLIIFWPRLSIDQGEIIDPKNPFKTSFVIKNDGYVFCYPVHYSLSFKKVELKGLSIIGVEMEGFDEDIPRLCPNDSSTFSLRRTIDMPANFVQAAEIYIDLSYKPQWLPVRFSRIFSSSHRFKVTQKENGDYIWQKYFADK